MAFVTNAKAGALLGGDDGGAGLEAMLRAQAGRLEIVPLEAGSLPDRIARARDSGADLVVIAGGDGTVACAAQALAGTETALGLIPSGTMNLLARDLRLDPDDPAACVRVLAEGRIRRIDAGEVQDAAGTSHVFLCASMLGTPARLTKHREAGRERGNGALQWAGFGVAAARAMWRNRASHFELRYGGQVRQVRTPSLTVVVNVLDDETGRLFGRARLDGGTLSLYLVGRAPVLSQLWLLLRTALTGSLRTPRIEVIGTSEVEVRSRHRAIHVLIDGELRLLKPPLRYTVRPGAVAVMAPG